MKRDLREIKRIYIYILFMKDQNKEELDKKIDEKFNLSFK